MRFFIGCNEICGQVNFYANELKRQGHEVTTCVLGKNKYYPDQPYDIVAKYWARFLAGQPTDLPIEREPSLLDGVAERLRNRTPIFDGVITRKIYEPHDVFLFIWAGNYLMRDSKDLRILKEKGKKIVSILVGSDVRYSHAFGQQYGKDTREWPSIYQKSFAHHTRILRNVELYSDLIYSLPDQMGLAIRPYEHFPIPLDFSKYKFQWNDRDVPVVVHAPSAPAIKGTDIIIETLDRLKADGHAMDIRFIRNMKNAELLQLLSDSDVLVDELVLFGPGVLSFEAMASGTAVATSHLEDAPSFFQPPLVSINKDNIYERVKKLVTDKEYRRQLAFEGRKYAEQNNEVSSIVRSMLHKLENPQFEPAYQSGFFKESFRVPAHERVTDKEKRLTRAVAQRWMPDFEQRRKSLEERNLI